MQHAIPAANVKGSLLPRIFAIVCCAVSAAAWAQAPAAQPTDGATIQSVPSASQPAWRDPDEKIVGAPPFVVAMCDGSNGDLWVGTEDDGVCCYSAAKHSWAHYTTKDGLGDDNGYALARDAAGRIWAGHLNHGVSVFNGQTWKNYDVTTGPLGSRIFAIANSPIDHDVWIASDAGVSRYSFKNNTWSYFTRADGLASDQINAIAFGRDGTVYLGTQCDGIDIGSAADQYKTWRHVRGVKDMPGHARGTGLPTNLINALAVADNGTVYAGTTRGLAASADRGATWSYVRGQDWAAKVKGSYEGPHPDFNPAEDAPLAEDYITALCCDAADHLWIGYRASGYEIYDPREARVIFSNPVDESRTEHGPDVGNRYITAFAGAPDGKPYVAHYGAGITLAQGGVDQNAERHADLVSVPAFPAPAAAPSPSQIEALLQNVHSLPLTHIVAGYLGDDWRTQGDWIGRYGNQYAALTGAGMNTHNFFVLGPQEPFSVQYMTGPHFPEAQAYTYVTSQGDTSRKVLFDPLIPARIQAEANDGSFNNDIFPMEDEGPDLWVRVQIPAGIHRISLYFNNADGHDGHNAYRDFFLELKRDTALNVEQDKFENPNDQQIAGHEKLFALEDAPTLATARVCYFWGPVYKQFIVSGGGTYWIKIARNHSFCTKLSGVFVDRLMGPSIAGEDQPKQMMRNIQYVCPPRPDGQAGAELGAARQLWDATDTAWSNFKIQNVAWRNRLLAYRVFAAGDVDQASLSYYRWHLTLWNDADRAGFDQAVVQPSGR